MKESARTAAGSRAFGGGNRVREKLSRFGTEALSPSELLGMLLESDDESRDTVGLARRVLSTFDGLRRTASRTVPELMSVPGVDHAIAVRMQSIFALLRAWSREALPRGAVIRSCGDIFHRFHDELRDLKREVFLSVLLDGKNRVLREDRVSVGSLTTAVVHPREVFRNAIRESADAIVFVHNHPSGDPTPSLEDLEITERLVEVSRLVGIRVLDHVVIGDGSFASFQERGLIDVE
jgi:DNA repair protein RadC